MVEINRLKVNSSLFDPEVASISVLSQEDKNAVRAEDSKPRASAQHRMVERRGMPLPGWNGGAIFLYPRASLTL